MSKNALLVIDMQNAYFNNGALANEKSKLINHCNQLIDTADTTGVAVISIKTVHSQTKATWTLNMIDDREGYLFGNDPGSELVDGLKLESAVTVTKTRDSAFFSTNLSQILHTLGVEEVVLCGVSTHSCVMLTAADAYSHNFRVTLARESIATHDVTYHSSTLEMLQQEYRQDILTNNKIIEKWQKIK